MMLIKSVSGIVDPLACLHQNPSRGVFTLQTVVPLCNDPKPSFLQSIFQACRWLNS